MEYIRLCKDVVDKGQLIPAGKDLSVLYSKINKEKDNYYSIYYYNEAHKKQFDEKGTISGITDVTTDRLVFDFDSDDEKLTKVENIDLSRADALELVYRLQKEGIGAESIQVYFSGGKGFEVSVTLEGTRLTPREAKNIGMNLAEGLKTFDPVVYNASRIFRLPLTKHQKSGLYKSPLTVSDLESMSTPDIMENAKHNLDYSDIKDAWKPTKLSKRMLELKEKAPEVTTAKATVNLGFTADEIDWSTMPKDYKPTTWLLEMGFYPAGTRNRALLILASRYRYLNMTQTKAYYLLKASADAQSERTGTERLHKKEIWSIINSVYSELWNGATFSDEEEPLLTELNSLVPAIFVKPDESPIKSIKSSISTFMEYAREIDKNIIKTGLRSLDENIQFQAGKLYGILAAPGVGKTTISLQILNQMSKDGELNVFGSYDMGEPDVLEKLALKHFRISKKELYRRVKEDDKFMEKLEMVLTREYPHTQFIFKTGQTLDELKKSLKDIEKNTGRKVRVLVVDYLELIQSKFSDPTQASMESIQGLREIAISMNICVITLLQPSKMGTNINEPVTSYSSAKGSSSIGQALTAMLTLHRPGYSSRTPENDLYMGVDCVKNRSGALFSADFYFDGKYSEIRELEAIERMNLADLRNRIEQERDDDDRIF
jgi:replicative DNA helicase